LLEFFSMRKRRTDGRMNGIARTFSVVAADTGMRPL
jgi:hypothetical protein